LPVLGHPLTRAFGGSIAHPRNNPSVQLHEESSNYPLLLPLHQNMGFPIRLDEIK